MSFLTNSYRYAVDPYLISPSTYSSTDGWTDDNADMSIDTVNEGVTLTDVNVVGGISRPLTENLETKWVTKFYFNYSAYPQNDFIDIVLTPDFTKSPSDSSIQTVFTVVEEDAGNRFKLVFFNKGSYVTDQSADEAYANGTTYYITLSRDVNTLTEVIRTGSHTGSVVDTLSVALTGLTDTLDGIQHYAKATNQGITGYIRGVYLQNGVTSF